MVKKLMICIVLTSAILLTGCRGASPVPTLSFSITQLPTQSVGTTEVQPPTNIPTTQVQQPPAILPTQTQLPAATSAFTQPPTSTSTSVPPTPTATLVSGNLTDITDPRVYLDDRSTPASLMLSYFNAVNRQEYLRAYSYYTNFTGVGTFSKFSQGYSDTKSVSVVFGLIYSEGAAGSIYYTVPMVLNSVKTTGVQEKYAACYILRFPQPGNYGAPPITPLHIDKGTARSVALNTTDSAALAGACPQPDYPVGPNGMLASVEQLNDLSSTNFIDNRSDPVAVISSLLNSINRHEYVRAYSYWQTPKSSYTTFAAGYANTASVTAQFGTATSDPGAGQIYYALPVAMKAMLTDGTLQTFIGCYKLHLSQPSFQATPPFAPMGIIGGSFKQVSNNTDVASMLATSCQP